MVRLGGQQVAETRDAWCVLETSHPPTYYLPRSCFSPGALQLTLGNSICEWKGQAVYLDVIAGDAVAHAAAWTYPEPTGHAAVLRDHVAVYAAAMDECLVNGSPVKPQPGGFYGGWITPAVCGPFKGEPGTQFW